MSMLKYWVWLSECQGVRNQVKLALLERFGTPEAVYFTDPGDLPLTEGITKDEAAALADRDLSAADRILADCQRLDLRLLTLTDADYPVRLRSIFDPPCLLYVKGRLPAMDEEAALALVGTRTATPYGVKAAEQLAFGLAQAGAVVVTGLARGIDSACARGALRGGGKVVGVLGGGIDVVYPRGSDWLYADVSASGALVSEYPPGTEPLPGHFPVRNRILSGLSVAALVVEAPARSGALITAGLALEQGRDVYAVPGPIDAPESLGCNRLIRDGAGLVSEPWDLLRDYGDQFPGKLAPRPDLPPEPLGELPKERTEAVPALPALSAALAGLTDDQMLLLRTLTPAPMLTDELIAQTELPARRVLSALTMLELDGYAAQAEGRRYARTVTLTE